ncbi:MAG: penicillin-binding protein activator LpoB [Proteobacteria bacterium]|nr:penicillin-binding protein activator LpoB [Pseudomonadota bacterium]
MFQRTYLLCVALLIVFSFVSGCSKSIRYGDPKGIETVSIEFGSTDLQKVAEEMTRSMLVSRLVVEGNRPFITVQDVKNLTSEYIDTRGITDSIRTELARSGAVQFVVDEDAMAQQVSELERQQDDEYYDQETVAEKGRMVGATYRLMGSVRSIVKQNSDVKDVYYKVNLQVWEIRSGILAWSDETEIRKIRD